MTEGIKDKIVVVTGASSGLGEATARLLSAQGATVVLGARRADRLESLAKEFERHGGKALAVTTDVTRREQVKALVDSAVQTYGRIDVMINNAGLMPQAPLERLKIDEWDRMIDVNVKGVLYGIAAALPHMQRQKAGHFINVSSVAGHRVGPGFAVYAAMKSAQESLTKTLALELGRQGIRVNSVSPDGIPTRGDQPLADATKAAQIFVAPPLPPIGFFAGPEDCAAVIVFLVGDLARFVTGCAVHVDGGIHAAGGWHLVPD